ncbi:MAG: GGDEF domain-containing protein [Acidimicrobiales bacterium]
MRRVSIAMFVGGGITSGIAVWTTQQTPQAQMAQSCFAGILLVCGVGIALMPGVTRPALEAAALASMTLVGVLIALSEPLGTAPMFFLWPVALLANFSSPRLTAAGYGVSVAALAAGLLVNDGATLRVDTFIGTTTSLGLMAWLISSMTTKERQLRAELAFAAETDPLTGLLNRRAFYPQLGRLIDDAASGDGRLALVMFDLDHFKAINDRFGHAVGDDALRHAAEALRGATRQCDLIARLGGEEFAVALPGAQVGDALRYATRVAEAMNQVPNPVECLATSAGVSLLDDSIDSTDVFLARADEALYSAKVAGRGRPGTWGPAGITIGEPFVPTTPPEPSTEGHATAAAALRRPFAPSSLAVPDVPSPREGHRSRSST